MKISEVATPNFLLDLDQLEKNIDKIQQIIINNFGLCLRHIKVLT